MKKPNMETILSISIAVIAGISAFVSSIGEQKKDKLIKDMLGRIEQLENK